jgi:Na+/H+ antiporter NhaA
MNPSKTVKRFNRSESVGNVMLLVVTMITMVIAIAPLV